MLTSEQVDQVVTRSASEHSERAEFADDADMLGLAVTCKQVMVQLRRAAAKRCQNPWCSRVICSIMKNGISAVTI